MINYQSVNLKKIYFSLIIGSSLVFTWMPFLMVYTTNMEFLATHNESLAYRFFISESASIGYPAFIWQGHLTSLIQYFLYFIENTVFSLNNFRGQLQVFGVLTLLANAALNSLVLLLVIMDKKIGMANKIIISLCSILLIYGLRTPGIYYALSPDYYAFNIPLVVTSVWLTLRVFSNPENFSYKFQILIGMLAGAWLCNKASSVVILLPIISLSFYNSKNIFLSFVIFLGSTILTIVIILILYYGLNFELLNNFWGNWIRLVLDSNGEGSGELKAWIHRQLRSPYGTILFYSFILGAAATLDRFFLVPSNNGKIGITACWISFIGFIAIVIKRPSDSTMHEFGLGMIGLSCIWTGIQSNINIKPYIAVLFFITAGSTTSSLINEFTHFSKIGESNHEWEFFDQVNAIAAGRNQLIILINNAYTHGGVHELLLKGTSDFPSWHTSPRGEILIDKHAPGIRFDTEYEGLITLDLPRLTNTVIVWFDRPDLKPISEHISSLKIALSSPNYHCIVRNIGEPTIKSIANICSPKN